MTASLTAALSVCLYQHEQHLRALHRRAVQSDALHLAQAMSDAAQDRDRLTMTRLMIEAAGLPNVAFVALLNPSEQLTGYIVRNPAAWTAHLCSPADERGYLLGTHLILAARPHPGGGAGPEAEADNSQVHGRVLIATLLQPVEADVAQQSTTALLLTAVAGIIGAGLTFLAASRSTRRLRALAQASDRISQGDLTARVPQDHQDEIGQLAVGLERMRLAVADRDRVLRDFNDLLHQQVQQRTGELMQAKTSAERASADLRNANDRLKCEIAERERGEEALRQSERRYALAARGANDGLWDWDLESNRVFYSSRWKTMLGFEEVDLGQTMDDWHQRVHPEDIARLRDELFHHCDGRTQHFESEHRLLHKDGRYRWVLARGVAERGPDGRARRMAGSLTDITDRKQAEQKLRHQALHDELTGLPNRSLLMDRLSQCLLRSRRQKDRVFAVFFVDLDRFKVVNDSLGHAAGDQLLVQFAARLNATLRKTDTISRVEDNALARLGGDEFILVLEDLADVTSVGRIAERLQQVFAKPYEIAGHEVFTTGSIGVAIGDSTYERAEDLLRDADMAMYRAKNAGRDRYEIYNKQMHREALERLRLENDLRRALESQQFMLNYQPIVALDGGHIVGFEALVRWDHPERGVVSPGQFIPLAEETGMIVPLGLWVLRQACMELRRLHQHGPQGINVTMSVNLSKRQISCPGLVEQVRTILEETGVPGRFIKLELTESVIMEASEGLIPVLEQLRALGCQLHMDDFGTGYSSLSCLHRFPLDVIKIDRAFVVNMTDDPRYAAVVNAIVTLAHNLGMGVTAEGVETREQLAQVLSLECDYSQGHFFARPLDLNGALKLLGSSLPWLNEVGASEAVI